MSTPSTPGTPGVSGASATATDEARRTAGAAAEQGRHVAGVAQDQAQNIIDEARSQIDEQSRTQRDRLVGTLKTFGDDVEKMANGQQADGMAQDLARQVARRAHDLGDRIDGREPADLLDEVRSFARRRPGTFLLGALAAGVVAGRLTRGAKEAKSSDGADAEHGSGIGVYDDVRATAAPDGGTAAGAPTAGVASPEAPPAYPVGSSVDEPGTTMEQSTPGGRGTL